MTLQVATLIQRALIDPTVSQLDEHEELPTIDVDITSEEVGDGVIAQTISCKCSGGATCCA